MILNLVIKLSSVVEEGVSHNCSHLISCFLLAGQRLQPVTELLNSLTCRGRNDDDVLVIITRVIHLDVEECSELLLRQQSNAIKNQLGHPEHKDS